MFKGLLSLLPFLRTVADAWNNTLAFLTARESRQAGRNEAIIAQHEANKAAIDTGLEARRAARARDADPDGLREDDGYRRN
jgi:hypothetical protein